MAGSRTAAAKADEPRDDSTGARVAVATVHVHAPEGVVVYAPGDPIASEHIALIANDEAWADAPESASSDQE